jgi:general stress protein 26
MTITPPHALRERARVPSNYGKTLDDSGLLTWDQVEGRIASAANYWICSMNPDGSPHVRPLWGVYLDGLLYFDGFFKSRWFSNLKANPAITVHLEDGSSAVIMEGRAEITEGMELAEKIAAAYAVKYPPYAPDPDPGGYVLRPRAIYAWSNGNVEHTATRWMFE